MMAFVSLSAPGWLDRGMWGCGCLLFPLQLFSTLRETKAIIFSLCPPRREARAVPLSHTLSPSPSPHHSTSSPPSHHLLPSCPSSPAPHQRAPPSISPSPPIRQLGRLLLQPANHLGGRAQHQKDG